MRRLVLVFLFAIAPVSSAVAQTLTVKDIIQLTKAALADEVLLALIEVHRPVFPIDPETLKVLKDSGVRPTVIVAMVKSGREQPPVEVVPEPAVPVATLPPAPPVVIVEREQAYEPRVREVAVPVAVPVYVPVRVRPRHDDDVRPPTRSVEPVFWGFGGKLRPDAWQPSPHRTKEPKDLKPGEVQKK
jgi:hypothetical protein